MRIKMINTTSCPSEGWEYKGGSIQDVSVFWASRLIREGNAVAMEPFPTYPKPVVLPSVTVEPVKPESFDPLPTPVVPIRRKSSKPVRDLGVE